MKRLAKSETCAAVVLTVFATVTTALVPTPASAFCGFYVAKADAKLFNKSSARP